MALLPGLCAVREPIVSEEKQLREVSTLPAAFESERRLTTLSNGVLRAGSAILFTSTLKFCQDKADDAVFA